MSIAPVPQIFTYQTRIGPDAALDTCAELYGRIERKVFADIQRGEQPRLLKFPVPVRNHGKHVWSFWRGVSTALKAALAAQYRPAKSRSLTPVVGKSAEAL